MFISPFGWLLFFFVVFSIPHGAILRKCAIFLFGLFPAAHGAGNGHQQRFGNVTRGHTEAMHCFGRIETRQFFEAVRTEMRIRVRSAACQQQITDAVLQQHLVGRFHIASVQPYEIRILIDAQQLGQIIRMVILYCVLGR